MALPWTTAQPCRHHPSCRCVYFLRKPAVASGSASTSLAAHPPACQFYTIWSGCRFTSSSALPSPQTRDFLWPSPPGHTSWASQIRGSFQALFCTPGPPGISWCAIGFFSTSESRYPLGLSGRGDIRFQGRVPVRCSSLPLLPQSLAVPRVQRFFSVFLPPDYLLCTCHPMRRGDWFTYVSSPHYLAEILLYCGIALVSPITHAGSRFLWSSLLTSALPQTTSLPLSTILPMIAFVALNLAVGAASVRTRCRLSKHRSSSGSLARAARSFHALRSSHVHSFVRSPALIRIPLTPKPRKTHTWYKNKFPKYPSQRRALIPGLF